MAKIKVDPRGLSFDDYNYRLVENDWQSVVSYRQLMLVQISTNTGPQQRFRPAGDRFLPGTMHDMLYGGLRTLVPIEYDDYRREEAAKKLAAADKARFGRFKMGNIYRRSMVVHSAGTPAWSTKTAVSFWGTAVSINF